VTDHPIRLIVRDDAHRNRLTVLVRLILAIPHLIWLLLWGIVTELAVIVSWFATLFMGRTPDGLHDFIARYTRYLTHVRAYLLIAANPFPGFLGDDEYPVSASIAPPAPQNRWITGFRLILIIPAAIVAALIGHLLEFLAFFAWVVGIVLGRMPAGFESLLAWCIRFELQTWAYFALLTDRYPSFSPTDGSTVPSGAEVSPAA
jgi:Domain of unknown function (DUF4389)